MPKLHGFVEVRFVREDWPGPLLGYKWTRITEPDAIEAYALRCERAVVRGRDQIRLCEEIGHESSFGCGRPLPDGTRRCVFWLASMEACTRTAERTMLVRIEIPA